MAKNLGIDPRVVSLIREWIVEQAKSGVTLDAIAKQLGCSRTMVIGIRDHNRGGGPNTEEAFAKLMFGGSVDALRRQARGEPGPVRTVVYDHEDPELRAAVEYRRGRYPDDYLQAVVTSHAKGERKSREEYVGLIDAGYGRWLELKRKAEAGELAAKEEDDDELSAEPPLNRLLDEMEMEKKRKGK